MLASRLPANDTSASAATVTPNTRRMPLRLNRNVGLAIRPGAKTATPTSLDAEQLAVFLCQTIRFLVKLGADHIDFLTLSGFPHRRALGAGQRKSVDLVQRFLPGGGGHPVADQLGHVRMLGILHEVHSPGGDDKRIDGRHLDWGAAAGVANGVDA